MQELLYKRMVFMEAFKEEGWDKNTLEQLVQIDVKKLEDEIPQPRN